MAPRAKNNDREMPLSEDLRELRNRLFVCMAVLLAAALAGLHFAPQIVELLLDIGRSYRYRFVYIAPQELLVQYVTTALVCGVCAAVPVLFYEAWAFVRPGLRKGERPFSSSPWCSGCCAFAAACTSPTGSCCPLCCIS